MPQEKVSKCNQNQEKKTKEKEKVDYSDRERCSPTALLHQKNNNTHYKIKQISLFH